MSHNSSALRCAVLVQVISALSFMKLFVAVILDNFSHCLSRENSRLDSSHFLHYRTTWSEFDEYGTGRMPVHSIRPFVLRLQPPLGQRRWTRTQMERVYYETIARIPDGASSREVLFPDLLEVLAIRRLGLNALEFAERMYRPGLIAATLSTT